MSLRFFSVVFFWAVLSSQHLNGQVLVDPDSPQYTFTSNQSAADEQGDIRFASLLADPSIIDRIEMMDYQKKAIRKSIQKIGQLNFAANKAFMKSSQSLTTTEERKAAYQDYTEVTQMNRRKFEVVAREQLLPHQLEAIGAIVFERQLKHLGVEGFFNSPIAASMELTREEKEKVVEKAKEVTLELYKKIDELKREALEEVLKELPEKKVEEMKRRFGKGKKDK